MLDRIELHTIVMPCDQQAVIDANYLEYCHRGDKEYWQSGDWGNFEGIFVKLEPSGKVEVACSLHKLWRKHAEDGRLDNSRMFTITDALASIELLQDITMIDLHDAIVAYFEIGLSLPMSREAIEYIRRVDRVDVGKEKRKLFVDANFDQDSQKTSIKTKDMRKVMKIYDKTHESLERRRSNVDENVLRVETIYKRQKIQMSQFASRAFLDKYARRFRADWIELQFDKVLVSSAGMKGSQIQKAHDIMRVGVDRFLAEARREYKSGRITKRQMRTMTDFAAKWPDLKKNFRFEPSKEEREYRQMLENQFTIAFL